MLKIKKKACIDDVNKRNKEVYNYKHQKAYSKNNVFCYRNV